MPSTTSLIDHDEQLEFGTTSLIDKTSTLMAFYPGTFIFFIDLSGDDEGSEACKENLTKYHEPARLRSSTTSEGLGMVTNQEPNGKRLTDVATSSSIASQFDELLPDTQRCSVSSTTDSLLNHNSALTERALEYKPPIYPTPTVSPTLHSSTTDDTQCWLDPSLLEAPLQKLSCQERKRIIVPMNRPPNVTKAMKAWIAKTHYLLDPFREEDECWLHPSPPPARVAANGTLRPCGKIQKCFTWHDRRGKHSIVLNFGIVSKLLLNKLTKQQKDGFISKQWHLSHLCGNWSCLNPAHTTVEPGSVNISRNNCFSHRSGCGHTPQCMKDRKVPLGADGRQVDPLVPLESESSQAISEQANWDDWRYDFDDGDEFMAIDGMEGSQFMAAIVDVVGTNLHN